MGEYTFLLIGINLCLCVIMFELLYIIHSLPEKKLGIEQEEKE